MSKELWHDFHEKAEHRCCTDRFVPQNSKVARVLYMHKQHIARAPLHWPIKVEPIMDEFIHNRPHPEAEARAHFLHVAAGTVAAASINPIATLHLLGLRPK